MPISKRLSVVIFVSGLGSGGAERVAIRLCTWVRDAGHDPCLLTLSNESSDFYRTPEHTFRIALNLQRPSQNWVQSIFNNYYRILSIRSTILERKADVVVALGATNNILMLLSLLGIRCRKIISERADPVRSPLPAAWSLLRRLLYPMANLHISQSTYVSKWLQQKFPMLECVVIGNTAGHESNIHKTRYTNSNDKNVPIRLISISRLSHEKGIHLLINAFELARSYSGFNMHLTILGDGNQKASLVEQVEKLKIKPYVSFLGNITDTWNHLNKSDIFVMPSLNEGFPNALVEAMSTGISVVASRCQGGVEDILGDVPERYALEFAPGDTVALAEKIITLAENPQLRQQLGDSARRRASDFSEKQIEKKWIKALEI
jgi:GalNAc-alpha-(1->4)-GalNAc-alpha-(1->3)-diNAcBac-PP-undecaprenol alpha-1,4-N-acetyl-D-galactosaminyltransferase